MKLDSIEFKEFTARDKIKEPFTIRKYIHEEDREKLIQMYENFDPSLRCLGLPPITRVAIENWIDYLAKNGFALVAEKDGRIIGHVVIVPTEDGKKADITIFIHQDFQNRGVGQILMKTMIDLCRKIGFDGIMLVTERTNARAIHVYKKLGFEVVSPYIEYDMYLDLKKSEGTEKPEESKEEKVVISPA
ncbi:GNAT family N-acetyltransferase [Archaeoglobus sulfaticallidus]|nr:GNAT family N-acetyltransferase [Archaeoglobus sulfaticallidus]